MTLSHRSQQIKPSPTITIASRARELQNAGKDIINLSIGEPDFDTPEHIKEAARRALHDGYTKYTAVDGIPELKKAIANKFQRDNQLNYSSNEIIVSNGCKQAIYNALCALVDPGDEVLIPGPYWVSYPDMVLLAEGTPKFIESSVEQHFKITKEQLEKAITAKTKLIILNSPSNPTGLVYKEQELVALAEVLLKHPHVTILTDDMYEYILWNNKPFKNIVNVCPALKERTIICHGVSKTYAMTGWRIGFAAGNSEIINAMKNIQSQSTSNPNSIAQYASVAALEGDQTCVSEMTKAYQHRHQLFYDGIKTLPGVKAHPADGTFYCFADFTNAMAELGKFSSDIEFAEFLLTETGIVSIPGSAFGNPNCQRFSYATDESRVIEAVKRLQKLWGLTK